MKLYVTDTTTDIFKKLVDTDYWVLCYTEYGAKIYMHIVKAYAGEVTYSYCGSERRENEPEYLGIEFIMRYFQIKPIKEFKVVTPIELLTTEELLEPICEAQGVTVEETIARYSRTYS